MVRRFFSDKERKELWESSDGLCGLCKSPLGIDWEADHTVRFADAKITNKLLSQPLCKPCHLKKTSMENQGMTQPFLPGLAAFEFDFDKEREGAKQCWIAALEMFGQKQILSFVLPTRYGKSDTMRTMSALMMFGWKRGAQIIQPVASKTLYLSHVANLRSQMVMKKKWDKWYKRINGSGAPIKTFELKRGFENSTRSSVLNQLQRSANFHAATISLVVENIDTFCQWVDYELRATGKPVLIHVDECQFFGFSKPWGQAIAKLLEAGALVAMWTATPVRADGDIIPGFDVNILDEQECKYSIFKESKESDKWIKETFAGTRFTIDQRPDVIVPFSDAWEQNLLCHFSLETFDIDFAEVSEDSSLKDGGSLAEFAKDKARKYLSKALRHPLVVRAAVTKFIHELLLKKKASSSYKGVVFCQSDIGSEEDQHLKQVEAEIKKQHPEFKVLRCTQKSLDDTDKALLDFNDSHYDVILVKQMASAGWDCPNAKVELDLSTVRQIASCCQRWMRVATPPEDGKTMTCTLILPKDALTDMLWQVIVTGNGGQSVKTEVEKVLEEAIDKKDGNQSTEKNFVPIGFKDSSFSDNKGNYHAGDKNPLLDVLKLKYPAVFATETAAGLMTTLSESGEFDFRPHAQSDKYKMEDPQALRDDCNQVAKLIVNRKFRKSGQEFIKFDWDSAYAEIWNEAKTRSGVDRTLGLQQILVIEDLKRILAVLTDMNQNGSQEN